MVQLLHKLLVVLLVILIHQMFNFQLPIHYSMIWLELMLLVIQWRQVMLILHHQIFHVIHNYKLNQFQLIQVIQVVITVHIIIQKFQQLTIIHLTVQVIGILQLSQLATIVIIVKLVKLPMFYSHSSIQILLHL